MHVDHEKKSFYEVGVSLALKQAGLSEWWSRKNKELENSGFGGGYMMGHLAGQNSMPFGAMSSWQGGGPMMMPPSSYRK